LQAVSENVVFFIPFPLLADIQVKAIKRPYVLFFRAALFGLPFAVEFNDPVP
jgi:hypothetical protein